MKILMTVFHCTPKIWNHKVKDGESIDKVDSVEDAEGLGGGYDWFSKYCKILVPMCFFGGLSAFVGYVLARMFRCRYRL